jgi:protein BCP1
MGKKRSREVDGQGDVTMADPAVDKKNEDDSSDDEVRTNSL